MRKNVELVGYPIAMDKAQPPAMFVPQIISVSFNADLVTQWIQYCGRHHKSLCAQVNQLRQSLWLIDCRGENRHHVVEAPLDAPYVALSYVWSSSKATSAHGLDISGDGKPKLPLSLPLVVEDAIKVVKDLRFRYLWIDKFCIDQKDEAMMSMQIQHMDAVYEAADITIIAAAGEDEDFGLPGVSKPSRTTQPVAVIDDSLSVISSMRDPHSSIQGSRWWTRGWTFQEGVLSRRRLVFTKEQVYFECNAMNCYESLQSPLDQLHIRNRTKMRDSLRPGVFGRSRKQLEFGKLNPSTLRLCHSFIQYLGAVEQYSARTLRYDKDSLNAFRGVMRSYVKRKLSICQLWGVPLPVMDDFTETSRYFADSLAWHHRYDWRDAANAPKRRTQFPSWSWAGWQGEVVYPYRDDKTYRSKSAFFSGVQVMEPSAEFCTRLLTMSTPDSEVESTKELVLGACVIPADWFSLKKDWWYMNTAHARGITDLWLSRRPPSDIEFSSLLKQQTTRCILIGGVLEGHRFLLHIMVLERSDLGDGREIYSRIGIFVVYLHRSFLPYWTLGSDNLPIKSVFRLI